MPYRYAGLEPVGDGEGGIVRPGEIRGQAPDGWGPWEEIPGEPEAAPEPPAEQPPPKSTASKQQAASDDSANATE